MNKQTASSQTTAPSSPASPRVRKPVDPRKAALKAEYLAGIRSVEREDASSRQLRVIIEKRLPKMVATDVQQLFEHLAKTQIKPA